MQIPKIIHQIWSGVNEPLPRYFKELGCTWKEHHPSWEYKLWDNIMMNEFVQTHYPQYWDIYNSFEYNIQRWDAIRYLILDKIGGMYVDFDTECLEPHDNLLNGYICCFSCEPDEHGIPFGRTFMFNNALIASIPNHPFMNIVVQKVFSYIKEEKRKVMSTKIMKVMYTTGPLMLMDLYEGYSDKDDVFLIPAKYVTPFTNNEITLVRKGYESEELENKLRDAYSIHYFSNGWV